MSNNVAKNIINLYLILLPSSEDLHGKILEDTEGLAPAQVSLASQWKLIP